MHDTVEISVLMGIYNEPKEWLESSIESILKQTFTDFEFIIINDNPGSPVNESVLEQYSKTDTRLQIINNNENIGLTKSMNIALGLAKGDFIARMDADDIALPTRLEKQLVFLKNHLEYIGCGSNAVVIEDTHGKKVLFKKPQSNEDIQAALFFENPIIHPTLFFRRFKEQAIEYNPQIRYAQDYELVSTLSRFGKLFNIQEPLLLYRRSAGQISAGKLVEQNEAAYQIRRKNIERYLRTKYGLEEPFEFQNISPVFEASMELFKANKLDRQNLAVMIYSMVYYSKSNYFKKVFFAIRSQVISNWPLSRRVRLLLSFFVRFRELRLN